MKISFWGTGAGLAEKHKYCTTMFIESEGSYYVLDFGAPVEPLIAQKGLDACRVRAAFVTHMHSDHVGELVGFAKYYANFAEDYYKDARVKLFLPEGLAAFDAWLDAIHLARGDRMELCEIKEGVIYENGALTVRAIRTEHISKDTPSYAFVFSENGKSVLFTGDLAGDLHDFPSGTYDLVVCELAHFPVKNLSEAFRGTKTERIVFHHITTDPRIMKIANVDRLAELREVEDRFPAPVTAAYDGFEIEV